MSDKMRWRYGDTNPVMSAVDSATVIEIGDLLYQDTDDAKPASSQADRSTEATNQTLFAANFLGVAMQRSRKGDTDMVRVATAGVFEYDCAGSACELGDLVGPDEAITEECEDGLCNQQIAPVTEPRLAIARIAKRAGAGVTSVLIDIRSTVMAGGINGTTAQAESPA